MTMRPIHLFLSLLPWAVLFTVNGTALLAQSTNASNEALYLLMNAYQNGGFNPLLINSGVAEFGVKQRHNPDAKEGQRRDVEEAIREHLKDDQKKLTEFLEVLHSAHEKPIPEETLSKVRILFLGNDRYSRDRNQSGKQYKRLYDRSDYLPDHGWVRSGIDIAYGSLVHYDDDPPDARLSTHWVPSNRWLTLDGQGGGTQEFQCWGRLQDEIGSVASRLIRQKIDRKTFTFPQDFEGYFTSEMQSQGLTLSITGEVGYDSGAKAKVVEVKKGNMLLEKYHIDVERGYLCPYQCVTDESGTSVKERISSDYIREKNTGLFYPQKYRDYYKSISSFVDKEYTLTPNTLQFNQPVSDLEFAIDIPEGARVADYRAGNNKKVNYVAIESGTVSLAQGGYDLDRMKWLIKTDYVPPTGGAQGWQRWVLSGIGIVLILIALFHALYRKWKNY